MPIIQRKGAASSQGFGQFTASGAEGAYIEDVFSTYLYTGNGGAQNIINGIELGDTAEWSTQVLYSGTSYGAGVAFDSSGNTYTIVQSNSTACLAKYNSSNVLQWQRALSESTAITPNDIAVDGSGTVYVTGSGYDGTRDIFFIATYNTSGVLQWQRKLYEGTSNSQGQGVSFDSSGNVYAVGRANSSGTTYALIVKYNSSGTLQWQRKLSADFAEGTSIALDSSANIYVCGNTSPDGSQEDAFIAKYNSSGTLQWQRKLYDGTQNYGYGIAVDSSGNVYSCGYVFATETYGYLTKHNTSGVLQWQRKFLAGESYCEGVCLDGSGNVYIAGYHDTTPLSSFVAKYNSSGALQWQRELGASYAAGIAADASGNLFVSGVADASVYGAEAAVKINLKQDGSTTSGTAILTMVPGTAVDSAGSLTDAAGSLTDAAGTATDAAGTATDAAGTLTTTSATQPAVTGKGGLAWLKRRSADSWHALFDTSRGIYQSVASNSTSAQSSYSPGGVTAFNANGFSLGPDTVGGDINLNGQLYASWTFAEQNKFFDIVTYTGTGANRTIAHNLGSIPGCIMVKRLDDAGNWQVYHRSTGNTKYLVLNSTAAEATSSTRWNDTTPTASVFSLGTEATVNANGGTYVAYLFAHDAGGFGDDGTENVISCGSFTTDGSGNATVTLGYEPQWLLVKSTNEAGSWVMLDTMRGLPGSTASTIACLYSESSGAENSFTPGGIGISATGFSVIEDFYGASNTLVYIAIRRGPMRVPTDATTVFQPVVYTGTNVDNRLVNTGLLTDMTFVRQRNDTVLGGMVVGDRLRGDPYLLTGTTAAEVSDADSFMTPTTGYGNAFAAMTGFGVGNDATAKLNTNTTSNNHIAEAFRRAPGFFDVVCYTGSGTSDPISHNLGVIPQMLILKRRGGTGAFKVAVVVGPGEDDYITGNDASTQLALNSTVGATDVFSGYFDSSTFSPDTWWGTSDNYSSGANYVAYLFATCPGVSKVGTYTGNGSSQTINCGFSNGARFVLIKRTDSTGDWYVWDSARGIVAGNDPYLLLNSTAAEVTNTDYVDTYSAGFEITSTAPAGINANGGSYIFLAIA